MRRVPAAAPPLPAEVASLARLMMSVVVRRRVVRRGARRWLRVSPLEYHVVPSSWAGAGSGSGSGRGRRRIVLRRRRRVVLVHVMVRMGMPRRMVRMAWRRMGMMQLVAVRDAGRRDHANHGTSSPVSAVNHVRRSWGRWWRRRRMGMWVVVGVIHLTDWGPGGRRVLRLLLRLLLPVPHHVVLLLLHPEGLRQMTWLSGLPGTVVPAATGTAIAAGPLSLKPNPVRGLHG